MPRSSNNPDVPRGAEASLHLPSAASVKPPDVTVSGQLCLLDPDVPNDVAAASRLHARLYGNGWRARLVEPLLRHVYAGPLVREGLLRAVFFCKEKRTVGVVAFTSHPQAFRRAFFRRHWLHSLAILSLVFLVAPGALAVRPSVRRPPLQRGRTQTVEAVGEIIALAVAGPEAISPQAERSVREQLFHHALEHLRRAGITEIASAMPDTDILAASAPGIAAAPERVETGSRGEICWKLKLDLGHFENEQQIPESWSAKALYEHRAYAPKGWKAVWEHNFGMHPIHRFEARDTVARLEGLIALSPDARILDFGCGFGLVAELLSKRIGEVWVWDAARNVRRHARQQLAGSSNVRFFDPHVAPNGKPPQFDLILINSVVQYMTEKELHGWLPRWQAMLAPGGVLVLSDVIPTGHRVWSDMFEILHFAWRHGTLFSELGHSLRTLVTYWRNPHGQSLMAVGEEQLRREAGQAGMDLEFAPHNLTVRSRRWTLLLRPASRPQHAAEV